MPSRGDHTKSVIIVLSGNPEFFLTGQQISNTWVFCESDWKKKKKRKSNESRKIINQLQP